MFLRILKLQFFLVGLLCQSQHISYQLNNLEVNTPYAHFGMASSVNNNVLFTTFVLNKKGRPKMAFSGDGELMVFTAKVGHNGNLTDILPVKVDPNANLGTINTAIITKNGKTIYIATTYTNKNRPKGQFNLDNFHIEKGEFKAGIGFTNFKVLPFCLPQFSYAHPCLSADEKTLYFISNFRGGRHSAKGGTDIFRVEVKADGTYSDIYNLGTKVNSHSREMFPTMGVDGELYFSSNRPSGFGGFDIYKSEKDSKGTFKKAEKLPKPLNSEKDDFSLVLLANQSSGYLVSKRKGGKGDDDMYYFSKN